MEYLFGNKVPDFNKMPDGLIPTIVQDASTGTVLMLGYMNAAALDATRQTGLATFFSRTKQRLWVKGETSGHFLRVQQIRLDCDQDALLVKAMPTGPVCHTGDDTCWKESNRPSGFLQELEQIILQRKNAFSCECFYKPPRVSCCFSYNSFCCTNNGRFGSSPRYSALL